MIRLSLLALALPLLLASGCDDAPEPRVEAVAEIHVHGHRDTRILAAGDPRHAALLAELDSLATGARPAVAPFGRREVALVFQRGALEFRFTRAPRFRLADGEERSPWRVLLPMGVEPEAPGGESGALLLLGYPEYESLPLISGRGRETMIAILEGREPR